MIYKYMNSAVIILMLSIFTGCYRPADKSPDTYFTDTIVVWDSTQDMYHKLIFHTVYLENSTLSGFSLNTFQVETFHISDEARAKFETMKQLQGVNSNEVKCVMCHPSVSKR